MVAAYFAFLVASIPYLVPLNHKAAEQKTLPFSDSHFILIEDAEIHYRLQEPFSSSAKGNVLFIHGFGGSTFCWRNNTDTLRQLGYRVLLVDLPAFGYSDKAANVDFSTGAQAERLWHLCDSLFPNEKWNLVGHSMGGSIAGAMGAIHPEKTKSIVFTDGVFFSIDAKHSAGENAARSVSNSGYVQRCAEIAGHYGYYNYHSFQKLLRSAYATEPDSEAVNGYMKPFFQKRSASAIFDMAASKEKFPISDQKLNMPMLVIWGEKDSWIPIQAGKKFSERHQLRDFKVINGAGHCTMETHSAEYNRYVANFLNTVCQNQ